MIREGLGKTKTLRVGLIGAGFMGGMHAACYQALESSGVKVTAVADVIAERREKMQSQLGAAGYANGMELIEKADVDIIDICLPTDLHTAHSVAAMKKGRSVFCEKPICIHEAEMQLLLDAKAQTGVNVMVGQVIRLWPEYAWLKDVVDSGEYGRVQNAEFMRLSARPEWASENWLHNPMRSGGVAVDMHVHDVDFVRYLLGDPDEVKSGAYRDSNGVIQQIHSVFSYGNDVAVAVEAGWNYPASYPFTARYRVKFEKAAVVFDADGITVYPNEGDSFHPELEAAFEVKNDIGGNVSSLGGYYNEIKYFVEGLHGQNDLSVATLEEAIASVRLVKREIASAGGLIVL